MTRFRSTVTLAAAAALGIGLATPAQALFGGFDDVKAMRAVDIPADATTFTEQAIRYYSQFSLFEADAMEDWYDAEYFAEKATALGHGQAVRPEVASEQGIADPVRRARLDQARAALMAVLSSDGPEVAPKASAYALVSYDCWVEQAQEGHQEDHIQACRAQFRDAMTVLAALGEATDADIVAEAVVYFGFDQATLTPEARTILGDLEAELDDPAAVAMQVVGHADRAGPTDYNRRLSERRAVAVADALTDMGLTVEEIDTLALQAEGETAPAVATGDGVREPRNRRVVVRAVGRDGPAVIVARDGELPVLESTLW
ncbi:OmpA family protein [Roseospira goensis]|uniref:OOP family OmpA-OmpF porin n=1 Tax=Roseospira goensis TaxID=391922 RepID=A0A7W6WKR5_9PROT|nr:OmpA family protein [Roseospira goensis]MBB4285632.1 OOP family OmpA-OmpF porin [Roseospira goensis]